MAKFKVVHLNLGSLFVIKTNRLYFPALAMVLLFFCAGFVFYNQIKHSFIEFVVHELEIEIDNVTLSMITALPEFESKVVNDYLHLIPFAERRQRFTLIDLEGNVIADSSLSLVQIDRLANHSERPEFLEAFKNGIGTHIRLSKSKGVEYIYTAKPFYREKV